MADSVSSVEGGECNLAGYLTGDRALLLDVHSKHEVLDRLIDCLAGSPEVASREELAAGVYEREKLMSTGIGLGIAIPHVRLASVSDLAVAAALVPGGIDDYESLDSMPVRLVLLIAARSDQHAEYLRLLSRLSSKLKDDRFRERLFSCGSPAEFYAQLIEK